jgi:hypothetical protein
MTSSEERFAIPARPRRQYPRGGGLEYEGETIFRLSPAGDHTDASLQGLVEDVLEREPYTYGDWFDLPMPLYLVHDAETGDVFRVGIRNEAVEFHVLPDTESAGLRGLYDRLVDASTTDWSVTCSTNPADSS